MGGRSIIEGYVLQRRTEVPAVDLGFFDSNFWSAIAGAAFGGLIALVAQGLERRAAMRDRVAEQRDRQKALTTHTLAKLTRMHRQLAGLVQHFDECELEAPPGLEAWTWARPLAALPHVSSLSSDELGNLFVLDTGLFNDVELLEDRYQVAIATYYLYAEQRQALLSQFSPNQMEGVIAHIEPDEATNRLTAPYRAALNELLPTMRGHNVADRNSARALITRVIALLNERFGSSLSAEFADPNLAEDSG